jgi:seryl-tRNA synthetase
LLDVKWIRDNQDAFVKGLKDRGFESPTGTLNHILKLDEERRETIQTLEEAQANANSASKAIGKAKQAKDEAEAKLLLDEVAGLKTIIQDRESAKRLLDTSLRELLAGIPNMPASDVPVGEDERDNVELRKVGEPPKFSFTPKQHFEIGEDLSLMDFETAAKLSGSRFVVLKGPLARLERALAAFMLDLHTSHYTSDDGQELGGYTEINPPLLVRDDTMFGTGQLPKFEEDQFAAGKAIGLSEWYEFIDSALNESHWEPVSGKSSVRLTEEGRKIAEEYFEQGTSAHRYWLIPTAEVPLTNLVREDITDEARLPMRVTAGTPCFRAEAGAAGKDTRGMIRQHQFDKVELVSVTTPEQSAEEHERMTACAETVLKRLGLPYRVVVLCTGDMGFAAEKTYDIEVWLPGEGTYREISSCSNCGDFQARRMNARYRPKDAKQPRLVHTLNGSGVAVGRALIAVLENYQEKDGSVRIPAELQPYMGGLTKVEAAS